MLRKKMTLETQSEMEKQAMQQALSKVVEVIAKLRDPENGCPWDLKQTHASLKPYLLEEAYEVHTAIDDREFQPCEATELALADELGDVLLQVLLHCQLAAEREAFDLSTVATLLADKLIRRHPHVFPPKGAENTQQMDVKGVTVQWDAIKQAEKMSQKVQIRGQNVPKSNVLGEIPQSWPALMRAAKLSKRAVKAGFAWPNDESLWACVLSEVEEFRSETAIQPFDPDRLEDEMGDILFALTSLANHYGIDAETALTRGNAKFTKRFSSMEEASEKPLSELSFEEWDSLWKQAKKALPA